MSERFPLVYLVPLRLLFGVILVLEGWGKLQGGWLHGTQLLDTLSRWVAAEKPYAIFTPIIHSAQAHPKIFGSLITMGELVVGLSMLLGLLSRAGAFLGALMMFSIALGSGQGIVPPGNALLMGAMFVLFIFAPPGRALGVDTTLRARLPRWLV
jgi:uncharacterized membrane protein YphA (DoxX/SURF4 family)